MAVGASALAGPIGSAFTYQDKSGQTVVLKGNALNLSGNGKLSAPLSYAGLGLDGQLVELPGLIDWIRQGRVSRNTWVFREDKGEWVRASDMAELKMLPPC